ncbi:MAG: DUF494 domain-containing protein [Ferrovum sp.]|nr:DUF494 domain-containing protein [Ferrovum sp.]NDU88191.1 DUF494 domain-containing protein [Ferrovum sp.]
MVDILIFMYENFFGSGIYPAHTVLANRLYAAGFEETEVSGTLAWLESLRKESSDTQGFSTAGPDARWQSSLAQRPLALQEEERLGVEGWAFLAFLENSGVLTPAQRELILTGLMALEEEEPDLERLKLIALMVLWRQGDALDALLVEELIYFQDTLLH